MKLFKRMKDGGPSSRVWGYFLIEWKPVFSIVLLHFKDGTREAYHSHAFNALSWVLWGQLTEDRLGTVILPDGLSDPDLWRWVDEEKVYRPSLFPIFTGRSNLHKVRSRKNTWVLSFRGPWTDRWLEINEEGQTVLMTHGRRVVRKGYVELIG